MSRETTCHPVTPDMHRNDVRDLVVREMQKAAARDERFRAVVEPLGFFTTMDLLDGIVDAVLAGLTADRATP